VVCQDEPTNIPRHMMRGAHEAPWPEHMVLLFVGREPRASGSLEPAPYLPRSSRGVPHGHSRGSATPGPQQTGLRKRKRGGGAGGAGGRSRWEDGVGKEGGGVGRALGRRYRGDGEGGRGQRVWEGREAVEGDGAGAGAGGASSAPLGDCSHVRRSAAGTPGRCWSVLGQVLVGAGRCWSVLVGASLCSWHSSHAPDWERGEAVAPSFPPAWSREESDKSDECVQSPLKITSDPPRDSSTLFLAYVNHNTLSSSTACAPLPVPPCLCPLACASCLCPTPCAPVCPHCVRR